MAKTSRCPRCGHADTFTKGFLPDTCVCRVCLSQLSIEEIPGMGPDCQMIEAAGPAAGSPASDTAAAADTASAPDAASAADAKAGE